jgi:hypothetical protein
VFVRLVEQPADEHRGQAVGQRVEPFAKAHPPQRIPQLGVAGIAADNQQIIANGGGEQACILRENAASEGFSAIAITSVVLPALLGPVTASRADARHQLTAVQPHRDVGGRHSQA